MSVGSLVPGVAGPVPSRVAEIQARFGIATGRAGVLGGMPAPRSQQVAAAAGEGDFATVLAQALQAGGTGTTGATTPQGTAGSGGGLTPDAVLTEAKKYLGVPYVYGGENPDVGLDCSGFVQLVYRNLGIELPRVTWDQAKVGKEIPSLDQAQPGDLIITRQDQGHIGIYVGDGKFIHAPRTGEVVKIEPLGDRYISTIRRMIPDASPFGAGANGASPATSGLGASPYPWGPDGVGGPAGGGIVRPPGLGGVTPSASGILPEGTPYADLFVKAGLEHDISPRLLAAVAKVESSYDPETRSSAGAMGLMQLMPFTVEEYGITDPYDPEQSIMGGARELAGYLGQFDTLELVLAAYNAGPNAVRRYGGVPPYRETQNYIPKVLNALEQLGGL